MVGGDGKRLRRAGLDDVQTGDRAKGHSGEHGSLVVYADKIIRTETDTATGEESEYAIPFLKGYTVFDVEQIDGLPEHYYAKPAPRVDTIERIDRAERFFATTSDPPQ